MILISDGLIEFPKYFWNYCDFNYRIKILAFTYDIIEHDYFSAKNELIQIILNVNKYKLTRNYDDNEKEIIDNMCIKLSPYMTNLDYTDSTHEFIEINFNTVTNNYKSVIDVYEITKLKLNSYIKLYNYLKTSSNNILQRGHF